MILTELTGLLLRKESIRKIAVARCFSSLLLETIGITKLQKVIELNEKDGTYCCHSHDFCDSNMCMYEAMQLVLQVNKFKSTTKNEELWHDCWQIAKDENFFFSTEGEL